MKHAQTLHSAFKLIWLAQSHLGSLFIIFWRLLLIPHKTHKLMYLPFKGLRTSLDLTLVLTPKADKSMLNEAPNLLLHRMQTFRGRKNIGYLRRNTKPKVKLVRNAWRWKRKFFLTICHHKLTHELKHGSKGGWNKCKILSKNRSQALPHSYYDYYKKP